ncbi:hypothetical protein TYM08_P0600 [Marinicellulosiphila megalodicopiae]
MQDLDAIGFTQRLDQANNNQIKQIISWLAFFHAKHLNVSPNLLWPKGTYWHLATRPDELEALDDMALKNGAKLIDDKLSNCPIQSIVHGDAKLANFCFNPTNHTVAGVDFQYTGGGVGVKDLAYFLGSCLNESQCQQSAFKWVGVYFEELSQAMTQQQSSINFNEVEQLWRPLFEFAWVDFHRFLKGWSPGHWKINDFSEQLSKKVIKEISTSTILK